MTTEGPNPNTVRVTVKDIENAVIDGMPLTCATCVHFHTARLAGKPSCGKIDCGGPVVGRDFPDYSGQIPRSKLAAICLMCGDSKLSCQVVVLGKEQRFGLCEAHKDTFTGIVFNPSIGIPQHTPIIIPVV